MSYIKRSGHFPAFHAWTGNEEDYPRNSLIGVYYTRRGALRAVTKTDKTIPHESQHTIWRSSEVKA